MKLNYLVFAKLGPLVDIWQCRFVIVGKVIQLSLDKGLLVRWLRISRSQSCCRKKKFNNLKIAFFYIRHETLNSFTIFVSMVGNISGDGSGAIANCV